MISGQRRLRILIVENETLIELEVEDMVSRLGHEVVGSASTAQEAIAQAELRRPDVVLMDIQLNGAGDGIDAARAIRNRLGILSLFMTGATDSGTRARAHAASPFDCLRKPFTLDQLTMALDRELGPGGP